MKDRAQMVGTYKMDTNKKRENNVFIFRFLSFFGSGIDKTLRVNLCSSNYARCTLTKHSFDAVVC